MNEPKVARDAEERGEGICRTCLAPIWNEGGTIGRRKRDTGWSDRIERGGDSLVCFKAVHYRHVPLTGRESEIYDVALARRPETGDDAAPQLIEEARRAFNAAWEDVNDNVPADDREAGQRSRAGIEAAFAVFEAALVGPAASCHLCVGAGGYEDHDGEWVVCSCQRYPQGEGDPIARSIISAVMVDSEIGERAAAIARSVLADVPEPSEQARAVTPSDPGIYLDAWGNTWHRYADGVFMMSGMYRADPAFYAPFRRLVVEGEEQR